MPTGQAAKVTHIRAPNRAVPAGATTSALALHRGLLRRPDLVRRLADARDKPLALIVAPPGYGKSTLLADWAERDERPFVWSSATRGWVEVMELIHEARARHGTFVLVIDSAAVAAALSEGRLVWPQLTLPVSLMNLPLKGMLRTA